MPPLAKGQDGDPDEFMAKLSTMGYNDLCDLPRLSKDAILANLKKRFVGEVVYTYVGDIVVSVNPFKNVGAVGKAIRSKYKGIKNPGTLPPHIYALVDGTYAEMVESWMSQSILISGESGAGKTEAMKICLTYLGELSAANAAKAAKGGAAGAASAGDEVAKRLMQTNPVMEATGNAKTVRNNNSSRFGKHFDVQFGAAGEILGAFTSTYLLEKPRIAHHMDGERNYHVFYMLCKAGAEVRDPVRLTKWQDYSILHQPGTVAEVTTWNDNAEFKDMHSALTKLGFSDEQRNDAYMMLSAACHLGNIKFEASGEGSAIKNPEQVQVCSEILQCDEADLRQAITHKTMGGGAIEEYQKPLEPAQADMARGSLLMHMYSLVFDWCVEVINNYIAVTSAEACIGVLDIFGFENFKLNSFPQLCINFTNESLHNLFIEHVFKLEQQTYVREEVDWNFVDYEDNQHVLDLIAKRPMCILGQLDEACTNQAATDTSMLQNMHQAFSKKDDKYRSYIKPKKSADKSFGVSHYAGDVIYAIDGFVEKNKDALSKDIQQIIEEKTKWEQLKTLAQADRQRKEDASAASSSKKKGGGGGNKKKTVGRGFGESLSALNSKLRATQKHYIRCLKPNQTLKAGDWDADFMFKQLAYSGTMEVTEIRKAGLNVRRPLKHFYQYYKICADDQKALLVGETFTERTKILLSQLPLDTARYRVGKTIMFLQAAELLDQLDAIREVKALEYVIHLQSLMRMIRDRKQYLRDRKQIMRIQGTMKAFEVRRAYQDVRVTTMFIQGHARAYIAHKKLRFMREAEQRGDQPFTMEEMRIEIESILLPGKHSKKNKSNQGDEAGMPSFPTENANTFSVLLGSDTTPRQLWAVVRQGTLTLYPSDSCVKVVTTIDLASSVIRTDDGSSGSSVGIIVYRDRVEAGEAPELTGGTPATTESTGERNSEKTKALKHAAKPDDWAGRHTEQDGVRGVSKIFLTLGAAELKDARDAGNLPDLIMEWDFSLREAQREAHNADMFRLNLHRDDPASLGQPAEQDAAKDDIVMEGYLWMRDVGVAAWVRHYLVIHNSGLLVAYNDESCEERIDQFSLRYYALEVLPPGVTPEGMVSSGKKQVLSVGLQGGEQIVDSGHVYQLIEGQQLVLWCGSKHGLCLTTPETEEYDDWLIALRLSMGALYQLTPICMQSHLVVQLTDGRLAAVKLSVSTTAAHVINTICKDHGLANVYEYGLVEVMHSCEMMPSGGSRRRIPADELVLDTTLLAWEAELRKRYGMVAQPPSGLIEVRLMKITSFMPQTPSKLELLLDMHQALRHVRAGLVEDEEQVVDICALALFIEKHIDPSDREQFMPKKLQLEVDKEVDAMNESRETAEQAAVKRASSASPANDAEGEEADVAKFMAKASWAAAKRVLAQAHLTSVFGAKDAEGGGEDAAKSAEGAEGAEGEGSGVAPAPAAEHRSTKYDPWAETLKVLRSKVQEERLRSARPGLQRRGSMQATAAKMNAALVMEGETAGWEATHLEDEDEEHEDSTEQPSDASPPARASNKEQPKLTRDVEDRSSVVASRKSAFDLRSSAVEPGDSLARLRQLLPMSWVDTATAEQIKEWEEKVSAASHDLFALETLEFSSLTGLRKLMYDASLSATGDVTSLAGMRMLADHVRSIPRCFAAEFHTQLWTGHERTHPLALSMSNGGVHLMLPADALHEPRKVSAFAVEDIVNWVAIDGMLVMSALMHNPESGLVDRRTKLHMIMQEPQLAASLLSRYSALRLASIRKMEAQELARKKAAEAKAKADAEAAGKGKAKEKSKRRSSSRVDKNDGDLLPSQRAQQRAELRERPPTERVLKSNRGGESTSRSGGGTDRGGGQMSSRGGLIGGVIESVRRSFVGTPAIMTHTTEANAPPPEDVRVDIPSDEVAISIPEGNEEDAHLEA